MQPTPNGALHIGHAAGTYLRTDAAARALAMRGHRVAVVTGSDAFENWVLAAADAAGTTAEQVCARHHADNERDLRMLGIRLDAWIDPRSDEHHPAYQRTHEDALRRLRETGGAYYVAQLGQYHLMELAGLSAHAYPSRRGRVPRPRRGRRHPHRHLPVRGN